MCRHAKGATVLVRTVALRSDSVQSPLRDAAAFASSGSAPQDSAFAFSEAYSSAEIVPESSSALARPISSEGLPATERM